MPISIQKSSHHYLQVRSITLPVQGAVGRAKASTNKRLPFEHNAELTKCQPSASTLRRQKVEQITVPQQRISSIEGDYAVVPLRDGNKTGMLVAM